MVVLALGSRSESHICRYATLILHQSTIVLLIQTCKEFFVTLMGLTPPFIDPVAPKLLLDRRILEPCFCSVALATALECIVARQVQAVSSFGKDSVHSHSGQIRSKRNRCMKPAVPVDAYPAVASDYKARKMHPSESESFFERTRLKVRQIWVLCTVDGP